MAPPFLITTEPHRRLVRVVMRGFWTPATVVAYDAEARRAGARMIAAGVPRHEILALVDIRELVVQAQDQIALYKQLQGAADRQPGRIATILSSALLRRQVERVDLPNRRIFTDEPEALA